MDHENDKLIFNDQELSLEPYILRHEMHESEAELALDAVSSRVALLREEALELGLSPFTYHKGRHRELQGSIGFLTRTEQQLRIVVGAQTIVNGFEKLLRAQS